MDNSPRSSGATRGRRGARRLAVQAIYQWLMGGGDIPVLILEFIRERAAPGLDQDYFRELVTTSLKGRDALDALLLPELNCPPEQLDPVEHAILLVGVAELRDRPELSVSIIINEAVELAKSFGSDNGHRFVNGVLDKLAAGIRPEEHARSRGGHRG
ncbi:MAG TPA: transcription antitermination factor NusB [Gammaproteobacteria bacterium]|nr:transcription antitermination factor NusB [Gammaproteobacteria bacterium]